MLEFSTSVDVVPCATCDPERGHRLHRLPGGEEVDALSFEKISGAPRAPYTLTIREDPAGPWRVMAWPGSSFVSCFAEGRGRTFPTCYLGQEWDGKHVTVSFQTKEV